MADFLAGAPSAEPGYDTQLVQAKPGRLSMKERLLSEKRNLEARLSQIEQALTILGENPQIEKVLEILSKTIY
jgi:hypothetical protein